MCSGRRAPGKDTGRLGRQGDGPRPGPQGTACHLQTDMPEQGHLPGRVTKQAPRVPLSDRRQQLKILDSFIPRFEFS